MGQISANDFKSGMKVEIEGDPYTVVNVEFVKPGKGQSFTRTKLKHLITGRVVEKTYKSGEKLDLADVEETKMRMLYRENDSVVFMHDQTFEQVSIPLSVVGENEPYLMEEVMYDLIFYKGTAIDITPPTFMEMRIEETTPGIKGDTASGRVLKPATTATGAKIQIPIFINEGEIVKIDTRTGEYVSRVSHSS